MHGVNDDIPHERGAVPTQTDFGRALGLLMQAHDYEIRQLRRRIAELESTDGISCTVRPVKETVAAREDTQATQHPGDNAELESSISESTSKAKPREDARVTQHPGDNVEVPIEISDLLPEVDREESQALCIDNSVIRWSIVIAKLLSGRSTLRLREGWSERRVPLDRQMSNKSMHFRQAVSDEEISLKASQERLTLDRFEKRARGNTSSHVGRRTNTVYHNATGPLNRQLSSTMPGVECAWPVMHPSSVKRLTWVSCCFLLLGYEIFVITMSPFGINKSPVVQRMDEICAGFWSADIAMNFMSGLFVKGKLEMRGSIIAKMYLRRWFWFDCAIAVSQWYSIFNKNSGAGSAGILKVMRFFRFLRLGRVSTWLRAEEIAMRSRGHVISMQYVTLGGHLLKFSFAAILFLHCSACAWYEVGQLKTGWVSDYADKADRTSHNQFSELHDYLLALHWSLSNFQGNVDIYPGKSILDRAFACASCICSIILLAMFVSTLSSLLVSLREDRKRRLYEVRLMRQFLDRHEISALLLARATHHIDRRQEEQRFREKLKEDDEALKLFPLHLREQLLTEKLAPHLCYLPIFAYLRNLHTNILVSICCNALMTQSFQADEDLFRHSEIASHAYVILMGELVYNVKSSLGGVMSNLFTGRGSTVEDGVSSSEMSPRASMASLMSSGEDDDLFKKTKELHDHRIQAKRLKKGDFVSEAALWLHFGHEGDLCCATRCECITLNSQALVQTMSKYSVQFNIFSDYANRFLDVLRSMQHSSSHSGFIDLVDAWTVLEHTPDVRESHTRGNSELVTGNVGRLTRASMFSDVAIRPSK